ncbi:MAG: GNAT family N-acetyltransferase [Ruminococcaceae bacterium]|nr:GNAT family N-acetyltransferase [Oscillospiraceae bacterium]
MIKVATKNDTLILAELAVQMWSKHTVSELADDFARSINSNDAVCFIKFVDNTPVGFAQCQLRHDYVEGTYSSPVGYLEGVFIVPEYQRKGVAKELLRECELWTKEKGCSEFASDCEIDNVNSFNFHMAMGFEEVNRVICFRKELN